MAGNVVWMRAGDADQSKYVFLQDKEDRKQRFLRPIDRQVMAWEPFSTATLSGGGRAILVLFPYDKQFLDTVEEVEVELVLEGRKLRAEFGRQAVQIIREELAALHQ